MDGEVEFGDIQFTQPERGWRPDQDPHFAVVAVGQPEAAQLPIYIHWEVMREIEQHVAQDQSIELGGILLGGQYLDTDGRPYVVVRDRLRAKHYQATKGSFKFTLDTWQDLLRRTSAYPPGTKMVGWYHSHPGWGIFLSEMDLFICRGFFNNPLDVALVVDPCQDQRGWFHWNLDAGQSQKVRNSGYYLFDTRFRKPWLEQTAAHLNQREPAMTQTASGPSRSWSRVGGRMGDPGGAWGESTSTVYVSQADATWPMLGIMIMLGLQTLLVAVALWSWRSPVADSGSADLAYLQVLEVLTADGEHLPGTPLSRQRVQHLVERQEELQGLRDQVALLMLAGNAARQEAATNARGRNEIAEELREAEAMNREWALRVQALETQVRQYRDQQPPGDPPAWWWSLPVTGGAIAILALALGVGIGSWWTTRQRIAGLPDVFLSDMDRGSNEANSSRSSE